MSDFIKVGDRVRWIDIDYANNYGFHPEQNLTVCAIEEQTCGNLLFFKEFDACHERAVFSYRFGLVEEGFEKSVEWNGDGLPPVGTICEHKPTHPSTEWELVKVVAHNLFRSDEQPCAIFVRGEDVSFSSAEFFRPIKTKEQLEEEAKAQEREKVIEDIVRVISSKMSDKRAAESLYELGYRKMGNTND